MFSTSHPPVVGSSSWTDVVEGSEFSLEDGQQSGEPRLTGALTHMVAHVVAPVAAPGGIQQYA